MPDSNDFAAVVLSLIRSNANLHVWDVANDHGDRMQRAVDLLDNALLSKDPSEVFEVTTKALASAMTVIARADDSSGIIGDACQRLLDLHPQAAALAKAPFPRLVKWMIKFQFEGKVDYFQIDPVAYAPALGKTGMAHYRAELESISQRVGPRPSANGRQDPRLR